MLCSWALISRFRTTAALRREIWALNHISPRASFASFFSDRSWIHAKDPSSDEGDDVAAFSEDFVPKRFGYGAGADGLQTGVLSKHLMKLPRDASVTPCLEEWLAENKPLLKNVVVVAITNLKRNRRYKQALEVTEFALKKRLFKMVDADHMYRLYLTSQVGTIEDVEKCFAAIPKDCLTEIVYNQLISSYIGRDMVKSAENALEKLKLSGHLVSVLPYNQFMSLYRHQGDPKRALQLIKEMNASNISPDTRTYNLLLSLINKQDDPDGVVKNYKAMRDAGVIPNILTYSLVAKAYLSLGMVQEAHNLAIEMRKLRGENSHLAHDLLLTVYAEQGKQDELRKTWKELERNKKLSARSYGIMIESLGKLGLIKEAQRLAVKVERKKMKLPARIYNALMDVYGRHGMTEAAEKLMLRISKTRSGASCVTFKHLIACYLKADKIDKALECLRKSKNGLVHANSKPWFESLMLILENLSERGEYEIAEHAFQYFTSPGFYRNTLVYNTLIRAYIQARNTSSDFLQRMSDDGVQPDARTLFLLARLESLQEIPKS